MSLVLSLAPILQSILKQAHGWVFVPICAQHGFQDGGVFVAVNCPFVVSLWALNGSLCLLTDKAFANSHLGHTTDVRTHKHRYTVRGVDNDVTAMSDPKLATALTAHAQIRLSYVQSGAHSQRSHPH